MTAGQSGTHLKQQNNLVDYASLLCVRSVVAGTTGLFISISNNDYELI